jgi:nucleoside-diphosphate-sugar epimerase
VLGWEPEVTLDEGLRRLLGTQTGRAHEPAGV